MKENKICGRIVPSGAEEGEDATQIKWDYSYTIYCQTLPKYNAAK